MDVDDLTAEKVDINRSERFKHTSHHRKDVNSKERNYRIRGDESAINEKGNLGDSFESSNRGGSKENRQRKKSVNGDDSSSSTSNNKSPPPHTDKDKKEHRHRSHHSRPSVDNKSSSSNHRDSDRHKRTEESDKAKRDNRSSSIERSRRKIGYDRPYSKDDRGRRSRNRSKDDRRDREDSRHRHSHRRDDRRMGRDISPPYRHSGHRSREDRETNDQYKLPSYKSIKDDSTNKPKTTGAPLTPEEVIKRTMEIVKGRAAEVPGIPLPKYYNPQAVDPFKYAERAQKRKLLWGNKNKAPTGGADEASSASNNVTVNPAEQLVNKPRALTKLSSTFVPQAQEFLTAKPHGKNDSKLSQQATSESAHAVGGSLNPTELFWKQTAFEENAQTEKFRKLMGMKKGATVAAKASTDLINESSEPAPILTEEEKKRRAELMEKLNQQYEIARMSTHTMRGMGLGFASFGP